MTKRGSEKGSEKTKGEIKMERYINDLIRNKDFLRKIKKLRSGEKHPQGVYDTWPKEDQEKLNALNRELVYLFDSYERLRKHCKRLTRGNRFKIQKAIADVYGFDIDQLGYIESILDPRYKDISDMMKVRTELDMCRTLDFYDEELSPFNKGEEIIHLNIRRQMFLRAYPVGIFISPRASKRDVLDYIEKKWHWIEDNFLRSYSEKKLKYGRRKHKQEILDFLWENRFLIKFKKSLEKEVTRLRECLEIISF